MCICFNENFLDMCTKLFRTQEMKITQTIFSVVIIVKAVDDFKM
jgi:hypothetical protein